MSVVLGRLKDREWPRPGGDGALVSFWVSGAAMLFLGPAHLDWWKTCSRRKKNYSPFSDTYWWVWNRDWFFKKHIFIIRKISLKKKRTFQSCREVSQFSCSVMSNLLWPHGMQHARPACPSPTPGVCSNPCPSSRWCHPAISSSVVPFYLQCFSASGSFQMSQFYTSDGQSIGASASASFRTDFL